MHTRALALFLFLATELLYSADFPVRHIILYKHAIAYFERGGSITAGEETRLDFKAGDMNDVLKSLTVADRSGARIRDIRYDSNETVNHRLSKYPLTIGDQEHLSTFFDR